MEICTYKRKYFWRQNPLEHYHITAATQTLSKILTGLLQNKNEKTDMQCMKTENKQKPSK